LRTILDRVGMAGHHVLGKNSSMSKSIPLASLAHQAGTCRFGTDLADSVLDPNCKAHEVDNL
jgi:choline dehydrogenase-like flavoprotein